MQGGSLLSLHHCNYSPACHSVFAQIACASKRLTALSDCIHQLHCARKRSGLPAVPEGAKHNTMQFRSTAKLLVECKLKYYRNVRVHNANQQHVCEHNNRCYSQLATALSTFKLSSVMPSTSPGGEREGICAIPNEKGCRHIGFMVFHSQDLTASM